MSGRDLGQKLLAILVILAMLAMMGVPPAVLVFFSVVVYFVWRAVDRSEQHETRRIFEFYLAAHEILRDDERRWYGFEISEVVGQGESVLQSMKDPPTLVHYALGALYNRAGEHDTAAEHLAYVVEDESADERHSHTPSPELRRYVSVLRRLEREPADGPQTIAAVRSLERARASRASALLLDSRSKLGAAPRTSPAAAHAAREQRREGLPPAAPFDLGHLKPPHGSPQAAATPAQQQQQTAPPNAPPPIAEVLRDLYEEEKKTA
jgi:hypothetical protein